MKNKAMMTVFSMVTLLAFSAVGPVFAKDGTICSTPVDTGNKIVQKLADKPIPRFIVLNKGNACAAPKAPVTTCHTCSTSNVSYHPTQSGAFHEQLYPRDASGKVLGMLDVSGTSSKTGVDWTNSSNEVFTWGTHTTKRNSATVVETRYQQ